ncbi:protein of unknown function [Magnetospirillum sp. XM-1]|nr:protein of unknown function [Magnetospirillum sp. XM-1]
MQDGISNELIWISTVLVCELPK